MDDLFGESAGHARRWTCISHDFLARRAENELLGALDALIRDVTAKPAQLTDLGHAHVIECADAVLATLIARVLFAGSSAIGISPFHSMRG